jgi:hypothetical protein
MALSIYGQASVSFALLTMRTMLRGIHVNTLKESAALRGSSNIYLKVGLVNQKESLRGTITAEPTSDALVNNHENNEVIDLHLS